MVRPAVRPSSLSRLSRIFLLAGLLGGCGDDPSPEGSVPERSGDFKNASLTPEIPPPAADETLGNSPGEPLRVVFLGDSLTAGLSLDEYQAFPARVAENLRAEGVALEVVNAGVSGDTSAGGLARLDWLLRQNPDVLVVELGANDGLRGLPLEMTEENLRTILLRGREAGARLLLLGMLIPRNYGAEYADGFAAIFPRLAEQMEVPLVPFLLEGVALQRDLNLPDGIHPNPAGHQRVAETVAPYLQEILLKLQTAAAKPAGPPA